MTIARDGQGMAEGGRSRRSPRPDPVPALLEALSPLTGPEMRRLAIALAREAKRRRAAKTGKRRYVRGPEKQAREAAFLAACERNPTAATGTLAARTGISRSRGYELRGTHYPQQMNELRRLAGAVAALHCGKKLRPRTEGLIRGMDRELPA